jgi:hypothetical protein
LLERFRRHNLTDAQLHRDGIRFAGFAYTDVEIDLRPVLHERAPGCDDVLECAIELIDSWKLSSMSIDLAELMLDESAPGHPRVAAGYALADFGSREARQQLKPLITRSGGTELDRDLKGLALRCNWRDDLTTPELLLALTPDHRSSHLGAYEGFMLELDRNGFSAEGHTALGLVWAVGFIRRGADHDPGYRIAKRIAHRAVNEIDQPEVANRLAELLIEAGRRHAESPLSAIAGLGDESEVKIEPPLIGNVSARRAILDAIAARLKDESPLWWGTSETPGLLVVEDFSWLLERALDINRPEEARRNYAEIARMLLSYDDQQSVEAWLTVRHLEPVASVFNIPLSIELESDAAAKARKFHSQMKRANKKPKKKKLVPPPAERVHQLLESSESKDPRFFIHLCRELTLEEYSTHYGFARFLTTTPGWTAADSQTRYRIVEAAKRLLTAATDEPERSLPNPLIQFFPVTCRRFG